MAIDKLKLITPRHPSQEMYDELNTEYKLPPEYQTKFNFSRVIDPYTKAPVDLHPRSEVNISTKRGVEPAFRIEMNLLVGNQPPLFTLELNPNKLPNGWHDLTGLVDRVFGNDCPDFVVSRIDINGELENVPIEYLKLSMRIPGKRKSEELGEVWKDRGVTGFRIGRKPSFLRVYDKPAEMKYRGEDVDKLPQILSRIEWQLHGRRIVSTLGIGSKGPDGKPPQLLFSELPNLIDADPFRSVQFFEVPEHYDWKHYPRESLALLTAKAIFHERQDAHDSIRILNRAGHFSRDVKPLLIESTTFKEQLRKSYERSIRRFFEGKGADIKHLYLLCSWCTVPLVDIQPCPTCGVRLCSLCSELDEGHEMDCPIRKEKSQLNEN
jgi:hypothetical protein